MIGKTFFRKYKISKLLGKGTFNDVYEAKNKKDKSLVAIKIIEKNNKENVLQNECNYLISLKSIGIPKVFSFGHSGNFTLLVMELLGDSIIEIFGKNKFHLDLKEVCLIAIQIIDRLEFLHSKGIIHRDIKPANFLLGRKDNSIIYIIDFGLAKKYISSRSGKHVKFCINKYYSGNRIYSSINAIRGVEQSRRDDLEALGYMLVFLLKGQLPWNENKIKSLREMSIKKRKITSEDLCCGLPEEISKYINYTRNLYFDEKPDYEYLRNLYKTILINNFRTSQLKFFWEKSINPKKCKNYNIIKKNTSSHIRLFEKVKKSLQSESECMSIFKNYFTLENSKEEKLDEYNNANKSEKKSIKFSKDNIIFNENNNDELNKKIIISPSAGFLSVINEEKRIIENGKNNSGNITKVKGTRFQIPQKMLTDYGKEEIICKYSQTKEKEQSETLSSEKQIVNFSLNHNNFQYFSPIYKKKNIFTPKIESDNFILSKENIINLNEKNNFGLNTNLSKYLKKNEIETNSFDNSEKNEEKFKLHNYINYSANENNLKNKDYTCSFPKKGKLKRALFPNLEETNKESKNYENNNKMLKSYYDNDKYFKKNEYNFFNEVQKANKDINNIYTVKLKNINEKIKKDNVNKTIITKCINKNPFIHQYELIDQGFNYMNNINKDINVLQKRINSSIDKFTSLLEDIKKKNSNYFQNNLNKK